ncbi:unnamed protein product [Nesidiocoris tenuis]|uniref:Uncharacterized protein n=1 Tax=Nesidiocoris tenuis TaxID=355587 RepID=A0A6H5GPU6_9HEMI|nr:unnamed protein product [Nesidiocoris tenuis]
MMKAPTIFLWFSWRPPLQCNTNRLQPLWLQKIVHWRPPPPAQYQPSRTTLASDDCQVPYQFYEEPCHTCGTFQEQMVQHDAIQEIPCEEMINISTLPYDVGKFPKPCNICGPPSPPDLPDYPIWEPRPLAGIYGRYQRDPSHFDPYGLPKEKCKRRRHPYPRRRAPPSPPFMRQRPLRSLLPPTPPPWPGDSVLWTYPTYDDRRVHPGTAAPPFTYCSGYSSLQLANITATICTDFSDYLVTYPQISSE